jgi:hypothetical protein
LKLFLANCVLRENVFEDKKSKRVTCNRVLEIQYRHITSASTSNTTLRP